MDFRAPLKIEQDAGRNDSQVRIAFTSPQLRQDYYGMTFVVKFLHDTDKAVESMSVMTDEGGVNVGQSIKGLGAITVNETTYHYFLARIAASSQVRDETTVQFNFTSSKLKNGKMAMEIFEGSHLITSQPGIIILQILRQISLFHIRKTLITINFKMLCWGMSFLQE